MNDRGDCRTAPATPGQLKSLYKCFGNFVWSTTYYTTFYYNYLFCPSFCPGFCPIGGQSAVSDCPTALSFRVL